VRRQPGVFERQLRLRERSHGVQRRLHLHSERPGKLWRLWQHVRSWPALHRRPMPGELSYGDGSMWIVVCGYLERRGELRLLRKRLHARNDVRGWQVRVPGRNFTLQRHLREPRHEQQQLRHLRRSLYRRRRVRWRCLPLCVGWVLLRRAVRQHASQQR
jgi:hypothetical protein